MKNLTPNEGIDEGDGRYITATLARTDGQPIVVDPAHVTLTILPPGGATVVRTGGDLSLVGATVRYGQVFHAPGRWMWRYEWNDGVSLPVVEEGMAMVKPRQVPP